MEAFGKRPFLWLWLLCIFGTISVFPYVLHLGIIPSSVSVLSVFLAQVAQSALLFGLICWLSSKILPKTDLHPFQIRSAKAIASYAVPSGILVGLVIFSLDQTIFQSSRLSGAHPPFWTGFLASFYGAFNEEVLLRLFLFTLIYFLLRKSFAAADKRTFVLWTANILVSLLFGIGHLPAAFKLTAPSAFEIIRVLVLNGIAGIVFGWLYWSRGLWTAIVAHFVADLLLHVFLI